MNGLLSYWRSPWLVDALKVGCDFAPVSLAFVFDQIL
jgi:hypothetical protein